MKVLLDGTLLGARFSGVERAVGQLAWHLAADATPGEPVGLFVGSGFDGYVAQYHSHGVPAGLEPVATGVDSRQRLARCVWQQMVLPRLVHSAGAAVFHAPAYVSPALLRSPHVVTLYDLIAFDRPEFCHAANRWHYRLAIPAGVRLAQRVMVPSAFTRRAVARHLPQAHQRCVVVPLGVESRFAAPPAETDPAVREDYRLPDEYLLWVGQVEPKKNLPVLLRAIAELRSRGRSVPKLVVAGPLSWGTAEVMRTFLAANLQSAVMFTGTVRDADLPAIYRGATAFCFPSLYEGFGLPVLEAMAAGVPVLAANAGALPEVVGNAGLLLPPDAPGAWADALEGLLGNPAQRADLIARGRSQAACFTWATTARQTAAVYRAAVATGEDEYDVETGRWLYAGS